MAPTVRRCANGPRSASRSDPGLTGRSGSEVGPGCSGPHDPRMSAVPVIALYGSLNAILNIYLANRVSGQRRSSKVSVGIGDSKDLELAVRMHGNNAEFVPLALVMLLIAELMGGSSAVLHILGGSLFTARVLHAVGLPMKAPNPARVIGTAVTWLTVVGTSVWILVMRFT